jgi:hypothetical protein
MYKNIEMLCLKCGKTSVFCDTGETNININTDKDTEKEILYRCSVCSSGNVFINENDVQT